MILLYSMSSACSFPSYCFARGKENPQRGEKRWKSKIYCIIATDWQRQRYVVNGVNDFLVLAHRLLFNVAIIWQIIANSSVALKHTYITSIAVCQF